MTALWRPTQPPARKNGKKYIPLIKNATQLYVIEKGALCGVVLDGSYNLTEAN